MIEVYKILTNKYDSGVNLYLEKQQDSRTRGHSLKLANNRYHYDLRKFSFAPRIVNVWNSLPEIVISPDTTDTFKRRLDKFWQHQDILFDYKAELTGVGNRSPINTDDTIVIYSCTFALFIFRLHKLGIEAHAYAHYTFLLCFALHCLVFVFTSLKLGIRMS